MDHVISAQCAGTGARLLVVIEGENNSSIDRRDRPGDTPSEAENDSVSNGVYSRYQAHFMLISFVSIPLFLSKMYNYLSNIRDDRVTQIYSSKTHDYVY